MLSHFWVPKRGLRMKIAYVFYIALYTLYKASYTFIAYVLLQLIYFYKHDFWNNGHSVRQMTPWHSGSLSPESISTVFQSFLQKELLLTKQAIQKENAQSNSKPRVSLLVLRNNFRKSVVNTNSEDWESYYSVNTS